MKYVSAMRLNCHSGSFPKYNKQDSSIFSKAENFSTIHEVLVSIFQDFYEKI